VHKTHLDPKDLPPLEAATLRRILAYVRPYWRRALLVIACMTAAAALNLSLPWFVRRVVDEAIPQGNIRLLWLYCGAMIAGPALAGLLEVLQKYSSEAIGQQVMLDLRVRARLAAGARRAWLPAAVRGADAPRGSDAQALEAHRAGPHQ
jgi:ATP-binding cassette subfamily B protein